MILARAHSTLLLPWQPKSHRFPQSALVRQSLRGSSVGSRASLSTCLNLPLRPARSTLRDGLAGGIDGWIFYYGKRGGNGKNGRNARRQDTEYVSDYTVLSPTRRKRSPFVIQSQRAKNLNRTHICRTSVAEPRKPCFTPQQAKIRRETGTLPFTLFNQSAADLGFFASVKGCHLKTVD